LLEVDALAAPDRAGSYAGLEEEVAQAAEVSRSGCK